MKRKGKSRVGSEADGDSYQLAAGPPLVPGVGAAGVLAAGAGQRELAAAAAASRVGPRRDRQTQLAGELPHSVSRLPVQLSILCKTVGGKSDRSTQYRRERNYITDTRPSLNSSQVY